MKVLFAGTPEVGLPSLEAILAAGHDVVAVLTRPAAKSGRGRKLQPSPIAQRAEQLGIEVLTPTHPKDADFQVKLKQLNPQLCAVVAYGALLPTSILQIPQYGWVNLHFSLLPRWRGAAPLQRSIISGDAEIGCTTFEIVKEMDAGPIYLTYKQPLDSQITAGEAFDQLSEVGAQLLVQTLKAIEDGVKPTPQPAEGITFAPKITSEEAEIDWRRDAFSLHDHIRGHNPDPGAWTLWKGNRLKIMKTAIADPLHLAPSVLKATKKQLFIGTGAGTLEILEVQPVGKKVMSGADWARGAGSVDGAVLSEH